MSSNKARNALSGLVAFAGVVFVPAFFADREFSGLTFMLLGLLGLIPGVVMWFAWSYSAIISGEA